MRILFEFVRWLIVFILAMGMLRSFRVITGSLEDSGTDGALWRYVRGWIALMACGIAAVLTAFYRP